MSMALYNPKKKVEPIRIKLVPWFMHFGTPTPLYFRFPCNFMLHKVTMAVLVFLSFVLLE